MIWPIGLCLAAYTIWFNLKASALSFQQIFNMEGFVIVVLGTIAVMLTSARPQRFFTTIMIILKTLSKLSSKKLKKDLKKLTQNSTQSMEIKPTDPIYKKGLQWIELGMSSERLEKLLHVITMKEIIRYEESAYLIKNLVKYPPAFGMMGTVIGMLGVFSTLNKEGSEATLGISLAMAMTSTLYGLILSHFILSPLSEYMLHDLEDREKELIIIKESLMLKSQQETNRFIQEYLEAQNDAA